MRAGVASLLGCAAGAAGGLGGVLAHKALTRDGSDFHGQVRLTRRPDGRVRIFGERGRICSQAAQGLYNSIPMSFDKYHEVDT